MTVRRFKGLVTSSALRRWAASTISAPQIYPKSASHSGGRRFDPVQLHQHRRPDALALTRWNAPASHIADLLRFGYSRRLSAMCLRGSPYRLDRSGARPGALSGGSRLFRSTAEPMLAPRVVVRPSRALLMRVRR